MAFQSVAVSIGTGDTDVYEMPATTQGAVVLGIGNVNASARTITLKFYNANLNTTTTIVSGYSIAANTFVKWPKPILMATGDKIIMSASNSSSIVADAAITDSASAPVATGFTARGDWNNAITYNANDLVWVDDAISAGRGASYIAKVNASTNLNKNPTTETAFWMRYAGDGPPGDLSASDIGVTVQPYDANTLTTANGLAQGTHTIWLPASAFKSRASNGAESITYDSGANDVTLAGFGFDATSQEYIHSIPIRMPKSWDRGTVTAEIEWTNTGGSSSQTVRWTVAGRAISNDDAINGSFGTAVNIDDTWLAQNDMHITAVSSAITIGGSPAEGDVVIFEVSRDVANDNMSGDAVFLGMTLFVTINAANDA